MDNNITAVILCGGKSKRIGRNKAFLRINNKPFVEIILNKLQRSFKKIIISTKQSELYQYLKSAKIAIVNDRSRILGSLIGIYSALKKSPTKYIFVIAVDMPTIEARLIKRLIRNHNGQDVVIPKTRKGLEPLCAIYSKKCLPHIAKQIKSGNYRIVDFFDRVRVKIIRLKKDGLFNVNTPKDYRLL